MSDAAQGRCVRIDRDEWWPVYTIEYDKGYTYLPEDLIRRYELSAAEFSEVQMLLRKAYDRTSTEDEPEPTTPRSDFGI